jgi:hypothetical protein
LFFLVEATMLMMVYDKQGEPFEVRPDVAKKLVIEQGWNMGKAVAAAPHAAATPPTAAGHPAFAVEHAPEPVHVAPAVAVTPTPAAPAVAVSTAPAAATPVAPAA